MSLVTQCAQESCKMVMIDFCSTFHSLWEDSEQEDVRNKFFDKSRAGLFDVFSEVNLFSKLVGTLFMVDGMETDIKSINYFLNYKSGPSMFARGVKSMLSGEVHSDTTEGEKDSRAVLKSLVQDAIRTASSCELLRPKMAESQRKLEVEKPDILTILDACRLLPILKDGLRKGEAKAFTALLSSKVVACVKQICDEGSGCTTIGSQDITDLQEAFNFMASSDEVLVAENQLSQFVSKHNQSIGQRDLLLWAQQFVQSHQDAAAKGETVQQLDANKLKNLIQKCGDGDMAGDVKSACMGCSFYAIREIYSEAGLNKNFSKT